MMVRAIELILKDAKVTKTSKTFIDLSIGEGDEKVTVTYDRKYQGVIVAMSMFGEYCSSVVGKAVRDKAKAYESENVELTDLRRQKEELERRIAQLEQI
jgi:hypothetical protein